MKNMVISWLPVSNNSVILYFWAFKFPLWNYPSWKNETTRNINSLSITHTMYTFYYCQTTHLWLLLAIFCERKKIKLSNRMWIQVKTYYHDLHLITFQMICNMPIFLKSWNLTLILLEIWLPDLFHGGKSSKLPQIKKNLFILCCDMKYFQNKLPKVQDLSCWIIGGKKR